MQENKVTKQKIGKLTESYPNVLNLAADPKQVLYGTYNTNEYNHFSDLGAWHGYYLPKQGEDRLLGGFAGRLLSQKNIRLIFHEQSVVSKLWMKPERNIN